MATNSIDKVETKELSSQDGSFHAVMIGATVQNLGEAEEFVREIVETFKKHRMISPPDTKGLLITLLGRMTAGEFAILWKLEVNGDPVAAQFMSLMKVADVVYQQQNGQIATATLLG